MKTSWALVVLGALLIFGACFAESINEAEEYGLDVVPVPAGAIEIGVVVEPFVEKITEEQTLVDNVAVPEVFQEKLRVLLRSSTNQQSSEGITAEEPSSKEKNEEIVAEEDEPLSQLYQEKLQVVTGPSMSEQSSEILMVEEPPLKKTTVQLASGDNRIPTEPIFKIKPEELSPKDKVSLPQAFEEKEQGLPIPVANQQLTAEMSVEVPLAKKNTEELTKEPKAVLSQLFGTNQKDAIVKEQTDVSAKSDKEQSSDNMEVKEISAKITAEETAIADEVVLPQIFQEVQNTDTPAENQQSNEGMTVEEPAAEKSPLENVVALPPVLKMILQKLFEPDDPDMIMQQDEAMVRSEMRLPRKVESFAGQELHLENNIDEGDDKPDDLVDERAVWRPNSNKRISSQRRKVNPANRRRVQQRQPNNWNSVKRRNVKKGQVVKNGQWVRNGQWVNNGQWIRKGQWVRRKWTNNPNIRWYNIKNGNVIVRPQNFNNVKRRVNGNKNGISFNRRPTNMQKKNRNRNQRRKATQFKKNQLPNQEKTVNLAQLSSN